MIKSGLGMSSKKRPSFKHDLSNGNAWLQVIDIFVWFLSADLDDLIDRLDLKSNA